MLKRKSGAEEVVVLWFAVGGAEVRSCVDFMLLKVVELSVIPIEGVVAAFSGEAIMVCCCPIRLIASSCSVVIVGKKDGCREMRVILQAISAMPLRLRTRRRTWNLWRQVRERS